VPLPIYEGGSLARKIDAYQPDIETQIRIEHEILQAQEAAPSIYSSHVSKRAKDAWEEKFFLNCERHRHFRVRDQDEITSERPGRRLHIQQFVQMLNTLPRRRFILNSWGVRGMRGLNASVGGGKPRYVLALDDGVMPEWSYITLDEHGLPKKLAARGWRAVLLVLLRSGLITESEMQKLFGFATGTPGALFRKYLFEQRNHRFADGEEWVERARIRPNERYE
jgi:hypothetical protein